MVMKVKIKQNTSMVVKDKIKKNWEEYFCEFLHPARLRDSQQFTPSHPSQKETLVLQNEFEDAIKESKLKGNWTRMYVY